MKYMGFFPYTIYLTRSLGSALRDIIPTALQDKICIST